MILVNDEVTIRISQKLACLTERILVGEHFQCLARRSAIPNSVVALNEARSVDVLSPEHCTLIYFQSWAEEQCSSHLQIVCSNCFFRFVGSSMEKIEVLLRVNPLMSMIWWVVTVQDIFIE